MKLIFNPASPFARTVRVTARELDIAGDVEEIETVVLPTERNDSITAGNPLGRIPVLICSDGTPVYDSRVICEYLAAKSDENTLLPSDPAGRTQVLVLQALAQGICDTAVNLRYETFARPEDLRWSQWISRQEERLGEALDNLESDWSGKLAQISLGTIATAVALSYLDFRFPELNWRNGRPALAAFHENFSSRPSMTATVPV